MSTIGEVGRHQHESPAAPKAQGDHDEPAPGLGWFFRTPFSRDWLFWVGVAFAISSLVGDGSYLTLMVSMLVPYWTVGALVSRHRRQGRPPVQRLRTRGWGMDAWCAAFTAFVVGYGLLVALSWWIERAEFG